MAQEESQPVVMTPAAKAPRQERVKVRSPQQWAKELGHERARRFAVTLNGRSPGAKLTPAYRRAATYFGWDADERAGIDPISLTEQQFKDALNAAATFAPFDAALSRGRREELARNKKGRS